MVDIFDEYKDLPAKLLDDIKKEVSEKRLTNTQLKTILERVRKEYENAKIDPGEAIGVVTAESFGEPGTQMSLLHSEKIIVKINNEIKIIEIGKFVDYLINTKGSLKINSYSEVLPLNDLEIYVPSINQKEKIEWKNVVEVSRHICGKKLIKFTTKSGRTITATDNHSFVTRNNNEIIPIKGSELKLGMRIPVINNLKNSFIKDSLEIYKYINAPIQDLKIINGKLKKIKTIKKSKPIVNKIELNEATGWFIGAYLAEGSSNGSNVNISNINDSYINNAKNFVESVSLDYNDRFYEGEYGPGRSLVVNSAFLGNFIINTCGQKADFKKVPDFAYNTHDKFVSGLLRGYFDGDGNFHVSRKMIRVSSNSKELVDGIALLLSRFRIFSYKIEDKKGQYWLLIPYKYAPLFLEFIGSDINYKKIALEKLAELAKNFWNNKSQDYNDMISGFDNLFYDVAKKLGIETRDINSFTKRQKIGRTALFKWIKKFEKISKEKNIDITNELEIMNRMFNSDIIWDPIEKIEYVDPDSEYVYDLSVPGLETFTTFDGIITHNTLNVKHFAGVEEMNVTMGLPRLIEIFDARKSPSTPSMEIYLKKEHSKNIDKVKKIAAQIKETLFEELASEFSIDIMKMHVKVTLDKERMKELGITPSALLNTLSSSLKSVNIRMNKGNEIVLKGKHTDLNEVYALKEKSKDIFIKGVKGVTHVLPFKKEGDFIISTAGTNLKDVLQIEEVDDTRTTSNDIYEVYNVLGIEAARQAIINEAKKVIENQGLDVDIRHILFISDVMTTSGDIRGITRSGITGKKESVLARASFETPLKHLINAALLGEEDRLNSVIENVILNQPVPVGTGLPDLIVKVKEEKNG